LQAVIKDAHDSTICALHFFQNEPVLLSAGADNSLKVWFLLYSQIWRKCFIFSSIAYIVQLVPA
jgi:WD40 repeat protein